MTSKQQQTTKQKKKMMKEEDPWVVVSVRSVVRDDSTTTGPTLKEETIPRFSHDDDDDDRGRRNHHFQTVTRRVSSSARDNNHLSTTEDDDKDDNDNNSNTSTIITPNQIDRYRHDFESDPYSGVAQNALASTSVWKIGRSQTVIQQSLVAGNGNVFSINIDDDDNMPVTNQKDSGRCWLFGTLNLFRFTTRHKLNVGNFEFSESYLYFFHLLEQANSYCENVIMTANRPIVEDRLAAEFLSNNEPIYDGGDWGIAVELLKKYGIVPKACYPETHSSGNTGSMRTMLNRILKRTAVLIRSTLAKKKTSIETVRTTIKADAIQYVYRILCSHLGTPPSSSFDWEWRDKDGKYHRFKGMTPLEFRDKYVTVPYLDYVSLIQDPRHDYYRRYYVPYSMPVYDASPIKFLNLSAEEIKSVAIQQLQDGLPVLFACNVEVDEDEEYGLWDTNLYSLSHLYGGGGGCYGNNNNIIPLDEKLSKKDQIDYGGDMGDHIMLLTGVDLDQSTGQPIRWRVENSWGSSVGQQDGYFTMNDNWFDANVYEVVTPTKYLSPKAIAGLDTEPIALAPWDPMQQTMRRRGGGTSSDRKP